MRTKLKLYRIKFQRATIDDARWGAILETTNSFGMPCEPLMAYTEEPPPDEDAAFFVLLWELDSPLQDIMFSAEESGIWIDDNYYDPLTLERWVLGAGGSFHSNSSIPYRGQPVTREDFIQGEWVGRAGDEDDLYEDEGYEERMMQRELARLPGRNLNPTEAEWEALPEAEQREVIRQRAIQNRSTPKRRTIYTPEEVAAMSEAEREELFSDMATINQATAQTLDCFTAALEKAWPSQEQWEAMSEEERQASIGETGSWPGAPRETIATYDENDVLIEQHQGAASPTHTHWGGHHATEQHIDGSRDVPNHPPFD